MEKNTGVKTQANPINNNTIVKENSDEEYTPKLF